MPCSIQIIAVNGITLPGNTDPTKLRITGRVTTGICQSGQIIVTSSVISPSPSLPIPLLAGGDFYTDLNLIPSVKCGDPVRVMVTCDQNSACSNSWNKPLECCIAKNISINAVVPSGALQPTDIRVKGILLGCYNNQVQVVVSSSISGANITAPIIAPVDDKITGSFDFILPITLPPVSCNDEITVTVGCAPTLGDLPIPVCLTSLSERLNCLQCFRAAVSYTTAPCAGTPLKQPITLRATIGIPAGQKHDFLWNYGDGTAGSYFTIDNTAGTTANSYFHSEPYPHPYLPGSYTARLEIKPPPTECPDILLPIVAQCDETCPTATLSFSEDLQCMGGKRSVTLNATVIAPSGSAAAGQWDYGDGTLGPSFYLPAGTPSALLSVIHSYSPPGPYTAALVLNKPPSPPRCPDPSITFSVTSCPLLCPTLTLKPPQVTGCAPTNAIVTFNIDQLNWPPGSLPISPTYYVWTVNGPTGLRSQKSTAGTVTSTKTSDTGWTGTGATLAGTVDLNQHGNYIVTVIAFIPGGVSPNPTCTVTAAVTFPIPDCDTIPPTVTNCSANASTGTVTVTFSEDVASASATTPTNFVVTVNGVVQTLASGQFSYSPNTTTITGLSIPAVATITVTVTNVQDKAGNVIVANGQTNTCTTTLPDTKPPTVISCSANTSTGIVTVTFSENVDSASATTPTNFTITVNGVTQTLAANQLAYSPNTTTITALSIPAGASVGITVANVQDLAGNVIVANGQTNTCTTAPPDTIPPTVASCSANTTTGTITVTFSENVDSASATTPTNFTVTVNGVTQTLTSSQLSYAPNTTTITGVSIPAGATVAITVMNVTDKAGNTIIANGATNTCNTTTSGGGSCLCDVLLWLAFLLLLISAILAVLAVCLMNPYLGIAAGILFVLAWIAYGLWAWLCAPISPNACQLLNVLECVVTWIIAIVLVLAIIIGFFTGNLLCGLAVLATEVEWGLFLVAISETQKALGCPRSPSCFGIPSPPTSSSSSGGSA